MDCILEHVVHEIRVRLYKFIQHLQLFYFLTLLIVEQIKVHFKTIQLHILQSIGKVHLLLSDLLITFFKFFLFFLKRPNLFVYLLLHHLVQVLLLNVELLHDPAEGFLKAVYLFIKLFTNFKLQF